MIPPPAAPAAPGIPHLAVAAAAALARDAGRTDHDEDADLRVDPAALELSRREGKQAEEHFEKFGIYD